MVDSSLVLDSIVAVSIAAGAFFAIFELRDIKKDRRTQIMLEACTHWATREFEDAMCKLYRSTATDAKGLEREVSAPDLYLIADYHWMVSRLGLEGLVDTGTVIRIFPFSLVWNKIKPWIVKERVSIGHEGVYSSLEKMAQMQEKDASYFDI